MKRDNSTLKYTPLLSENNKKFNDYKLYEEPGSCVNYLEVIFIFFLDLISGFRVVKKTVLHGI